MSWIPNWKIDRKWLCYQKNTFVFNELKNAVIYTSKSKFSADWYINKIDITINNAKKYENDIYLLKDHVGMNIHLLFEKLILK